MNKEKSMSVPEDMLMVEETRQRIDAWMGLNSGSSPKPTKSSSSPIKPRSSSSVSCRASHGNDKSSSAEKDHEDQQQQEQYSPTTTVSLVTEAASNVTTVPVETSPVQQQQQQQSSSSSSPSHSPTRSVPKGILRVSKYSQRSLLSSASTTGGMEAVVPPPPLQQQPHLSSSSPPQTLTTATTITTTKTNNNNRSSSSSNSIPMVVKDVVERPLSPNDAIASTSISNLDYHHHCSNNNSHGATSTGNAAWAIEGYTPRRFPRRGSKVSFSEQIETPNYGNDINNGHSSRDSISYNEEDDESSICLLSDDDSKNRRNSSSSSLLDWNQESMPCLQVDWDANDLDVSCMTQDEFKELKIHEHKKRSFQYQVFSGHANPFGMDDNENDSNANNDNNDESIVFGEDFAPRLIRTNGTDDDDDDEDEDAALRSVHNPGPESHEEDDDQMEDGGDGDNDDADPSTTETRAFLLLWTAISQWVTPNSVSLLEAWKMEYNSSSNSNTLEQQQQQQQQQHAPEISTVADRSDLEASRCAGLLAMLKMNIPRVLEELQQPPESQRAIDVHLAQLLATFDYSYPNPVQLNVKLWRVMTCILVDTVLTFANLRQQPQPQQQQSEETTASPKRRQGDDRQVIMLRDIVDKSSNIIVNKQSTTTTSMPTSAVTVGMKLEEYWYLTQSAIPSFGRALQ